MDFQETYDTCIAVFKNGRINTIIGSAEAFNNGHEYTEKYSVIDRTKEARGQVVVEHNNKTAITAPDTFEAVRWYLKIDQGEYTPWTIRLKSKVMPKSWLNKTRNVCKAINGIIST